MGRWQREAPASRGCKTPGPFIRRGGGPAMVESLNHARPCCLCARAVCAVANTGDGRLSSELEPRNNPNATLTPESLHRCDIRP
jgi:hypothetical protein